MRTSHSLRVYGNPATNQTTGGVKTVDFMRSLLFVAALYFPTFLPYVPHVVALLVA